MDYAKGDKLVMVIQLWLWTGRTINEYDVYRNGPVFFFYFFGNHWMLCGKLRLTSHRSS